MDNNEFNEVSTIVNIIDELLKHMEIVIEEVPSIVLLAYNVLPKRIEEVATIYDRMMKQGYPLDYLNVEYNISEATTKIKNIIVRTKSLNLQDSLFELKVLLDYFESIFTDFEKEKVNRADYEETHKNFKARFNKINGLLNEMLNQIDEIKTLYNLSDKDLEELYNIKKDLDELDKDYKDTFGCGPDEDDD